MSCVAIVVVVMTNPSGNVRRAEIVYSFSQETPSQSYLFCHMLMWCYAKTLCSIVEVTLYIVHLVLGWVTVCRQVYHLSTTPASLVDSFLPSVGKM